MPPPLLPAPPRVTLASDLWAQAHNAVNLGPDSCHYCAAPCARHWLHDDPPPVPFQRTVTSALRPGNAYVCVGCWLFKRGSVTVDFFDGGADGRRQRDRQRAQDHAWLVTPAGVTAVRGAEDAGHLYPLLLRPPLRFVLALRDGATAPPTLLQLCRANDRAEVKADTELAFTVNNVPHAYTVHELETSLRAAPGAVLGGPGVQALRRLLGPFALPEPPEYEARANNGKSKGSRGGRPGPDQQMETIRRAALTSSHAVVTPPASVAGR